MHKLFTKEDHYNIHKINGLLCISNFIFQFFNYIFFNKYYLNIYTIAPHILLHLSTFFFHVLPFRPINSIVSMFIWNELRLHSLLFAWRACFSILFIDYCFYISFLTIFLADIVTYYYGTPGVSTVRGDQTRVGKRNIFKEIIGAFFSISQIGATIITMGFFQKTPSLILIFSTLPPIQTSAFGMTLIRKNLINKDLWSYFYTAELLITYYIWYLEYKNINIFFISCAIYFIRRYYNISKYTVWLILFFQNFINRIEYKNI